MTVISVTGYAPGNLNYCPECGARECTTYYRDGKIKCDNCGLVCYIVEAEDSHCDGEDGEDE